ncbi:MAG: hypothetical protein ACLQM8_21595 [Limisphaerales bacterium]
MNENQIALLESALETVLASQEKLRREEAVVTRAAAELAEIECAGDLEDQVVVARAGALFTIATLAPKRRAALQEKLLDAQKTLVEARDDFFRSHVHPRFKDIHNRAISKAEKALAPYYSDPNSLRQAALRSDLLKKLPGLSEHLIGNNSPNEAVARARSLIALWANFDQFETQNLR